MSSEVEICNMALGHLGSTPIISLADGNPRANACNVAYEPVRNRLLKEGDWNFAMARAKLARDGTNPDFGFDYRYIMPTKWVRTVGCWDNGDERGELFFKQEGLYILTDSTEVYMRYIQKVTDPNQFSQGFKTALEFLIARDIAIKITGSKTVREEMDKLYVREKSSALSEDAMSDSPDAIPSGSWVNSRHSSAGDYSDPYNRGNW